MDKKDKDKIVELKKKADDKRNLPPLSELAKDKSNRNYYLRGLPAEVGEKNESVNTVNRAFVEDEMVRKNAQRDAEKYLRDIEEVDERFPRWMWFITGVLFAVVMEVFVLHTTLGDVLVRFFYGG